MAVATTNNKYTSFMLWAREQYPTYNVILDTNLPDRTGVVLHTHRKDGWVMRSVYIKSDNPHISTLKTFVKKLVNNDD